MPSISIIEGAARFFTLDWLSLESCSSLGGFRDLVVDVVCTHEFGGSHLADVSLNGQLRDHDPNRLLENEARKKVERYRDERANRHGTTVALLPCARTTSGRIHGERVHAPLHPRPPSHAEVLGQHGG